MQGRISKIHNLLSTVPNQIKYGRISRDDKQEGILKYFYERQFPLICQSVLRLTFAFSLAGARRLGSWKLMFVLHARQFWRLSSRPPAFIPPPRYIIWQKTRETSQKLNDVSQLDNDVRRRWSGVPVWGHSKFSQKRSEYEASLEFRHYYHKIIINNSMLCPATVLSLWTLAHTLANLWQVIKQSNHEPLKSTDNHFIKTISSLRSWRQQSIISKCFQFCRVTEAENIGKIVGKQHENSSSASPNELVHKREDGRCSARALRNFVISSDGVYLESVRMSAPLADSLWTTLFRTLLTEFLSGTPATVINVKGTTGWRCYWRQQLVKIQTKGSWKQYNFEAVKKAQVFY